MTGWRRIVAIALAAGALVFVLVFVLVYTLFPDGTGEPALVTHTDALGRTCTTATTRAAVAIDCDYPPADHRARGWLDTLTQPDQP